MSEDGDGNRAGVGDLPVERIGFGGSHDGKGLDGSLLDVLDGDLATTETAGVEIAGLDVAIIEDDAVIESVLKLVDLGLELLDSLACGIVVGVFAQVALRACKIEIAQGTGLLDVDEMVQLLLDIFFSLFCQDFLVVVSHFLYLTKTEELYHKRLALTWLSQNI